MIIAIASGKGGTGKTSVALSLAACWDKPVQAVDLDVEEPNLHLFLEPEIQGSLPATIPVPETDQSLCNACGACSAICQFKAITVMAGYVLTFQDMCHGCGGCMAVCPTGAIKEGSRVLGDVVWGQAGDIDFLMGRLRVGEAMSPPLMHQVRRRLAEDRDVIIDAPPGTTCPAAAAVSGTDFIVLVSEPTPFGFHDLKLAREAFEPMGIPMGVVINRAGLGDDSLENYCRETGLPVLMEIPFDRRIARAYSEGRIISDAVPGLERTFRELAEAIRKAAAAGRREAAHA